MQVAKVFSSRQDICKISFKRNLLYPLKVHIQTVYLKENIHFSSFRVAVCFPHECRAQISATCGLKVASSCSDLIKFSGPEIETVGFSTIVICEIKLATQICLQTKLR